MIPTHNGGPRYWVVLDTPDERPLTEWVLPSGEVIALDDGSDPSCITDEELIAILPTLDD